MKGARPPPAPKGEHLDSKTLERYRDEALSWSEREHVQEHVATCPVCRTAFLQLCGLSD